MSSFHQYTLATALNQLLCLSNVQFFFPFFFLAGIFAHNSMSEDTFDLTLQVLGCAPDVSFADKTVSGSTVLLTHACVALRSWNKDLNTAGLKLIKLLLEREDASLNVNAINCHGGTPFSIVVKSLMDYNGRDCAEELIKLFLSRGAVPSKEKGYELFTLLLQWCGETHLWRDGKADRMKEDSSEVLLGIELVKLLLGAESPLKHANVQWPNVPLHGKYQIISNRQGGTPLWHVKKAALKHGSIFGAQLEALLLDAGAELLEGESYSLVLETAYVVSCGTAVKLNQLERLLETAVTEATRLHETTEMTPLWCAAMAVRNGKEDGLKLAEMFSGIKNFNVNSKVLGEKSGTKSWSYSIGGYSYYSFEFATPLLLAAQAVFNGHPDGLKLAKIILAGDVVCHINYDYDIVSEHWLSLENFEKMGRGSVLSFAAGAVLNGMVVGKDLAMMLVRAGAKLLEGEGIMLLRYAVSNILKEKSCMLDDVKLILDIDDELSDAMSRAETELNEVLRSRHDGGKINTVYKSAYVTDEEHYVGTALSWTAWALRYSESSRLQSRHPDTVKDFVNHVRQRSTEAPLWLVAWILRRKRVDALELARMLLSCDEIDVNIGNSVTGRYDRCMVQFYSSPSKLSPLAFVVKRILEDVEHQESIEFARLLLENANIDVNCSFIEYVVSHRNKGLTAFHGTILLHVLARLSHVHTLGSGRDDDRGEKQYDFTRLRSLASLLLSREDVDVSPVLSAVEDQTMGDNVRSLFTALGLAIAVDEELARSLLDREGVDVNAVTHYIDARTETFFNLSLTSTGEGPPLFVAILVGNISIVRVLLDMQNVDVNAVGIHINQQDEPKTQGNMLFWAAICGRIEIVQWLLERKDLDVNVLDAECMLGERVTSAFELCQSWKRGGYMGNNRYSYSYPEGFEEIKNVIEAFKREKVRKLRLFLCFKMLPKLMRWWRIGTERAFHPEALNARGVFTNIDDPLFSTCL